VPNVVCAELLVALCHSSTEDDNELFIFKNTTVCCLLDHVWWQGAFKVDLLEFVLSISGLSLLIAETLSGTARMGISDGFVSARAVVDLLHELAQLLGYVKIGQPGLYLGWGNAYDVLRCVLPAMLFFDSNAGCLRVLVILIYWFRLVEVNFSESMSRELLPIVRLVRGLGPALVVAFVGFCALTHAFFELGSLEGGLNATPFLDCFDMLITGAIPKTDADNPLSSLRLLLTYASVLAFTVFFLNIFISVIGENYSTQKMMSPLVFQGVRSSICCTYLLRASVIPGWLCSVPCAVGLFILAVVAMLLLQVSIVIPDINVPCTPLLIVLCQLMMMTAVYQDPDMPWSCHKSGRAPREDYYLWSVEAVQAEAAGELDRIHEQLDSVRRLLETRGVKRSTTAHSLFSPTGALRPSGRPQ